MRRFLLLLFLLSALWSDSQPGNKTPIKGGRKQLINDSSFLKLKNIRDSLVILDSTREQKGIEVNLDQFMQMQKEQKARQKKAAMWRIAIGIALFIVLLIGLNRRRKKPGVNPS
jgi:hypothetical protein